MDVYVVNVKIGNSHEQVLGSHNWRSSFTVGVATTLKSAKDSANDFISLAEENNFGKVISYRKSSWLNKKDDNQLIWEDENIYIKASVLMNITRPNGLDRVDIYEFTIVKCPIKTRKRRNERKS